MNRIFTLILKGVAIAALFVAAFILFGFVTMYLWNWLMPYLFNLPAIDFYKAIGLVVLSKILFSGIRAKSHAPWGPRKYWKAKWESMSEEEREKFKQDFALRCKHKWGTSEPKTPASSS